MERGSCGGAGTRRSGSYNLPVKVRLPTVAPPESPGIADDDHFHDECGVFGIYPHPEAARLTYLGLYGLQHRGQEAAGIAVSAGKEIALHKGEGYVSEVFGHEELAKMPGLAAIGHCRYSTAGASALVNAQPVFARTSKGALALAHNGNLTNAGRLRAELEARGAIFQTTSDSEVILHLMAKAAAEDPIEALIEAWKQTEGAFSCVVLLEDRVIAVRDPRGFRPLVLGRLEDKAYCVASETCAFDLIDAKLVREIEPGEMVILSAAGVESRKPFPQKPVSPCIFEHIYFARPDSMVFGRMVMESREELGRLLAKEQPAGADIVVPVPDSGIGAALGFSHESGIPFAFGLIRNHYVGRTFIQPQQAIRDLSVKVKLNPVKPVIEGKRVVLIDDSIVRGTTSRKIVRLVRAAGAREVHLRISSPPTMGPCHYGIDTPQKSELIAAQHSLEEIRRFVEADSLGYLSLDALETAIAKGRPFCRACFDGNYPVALDASPRQGGLFDKAAR